MDIMTESLRIIFVVGLVAIPILYWLSGGGTARRGQDRTQNEEKRAERRGEEHNHHGARIS